MPGRLRIGILFTVLVTAVSFSSCRRKSPTVDALAAQDSSDVPLPPRSSLQLDSVELLDYFRGRNEYASVMDRVVAFYSRRGFRFAWIDSEGPNDRSLSLLNLMVNAAEEGVVVKSTDPQQLQTLLDGLPADRRQGYQSDSRTRSFELQLTARYFLMADASGTGLPVSKRRDLEWYLPSGKRSPEDWADELADTAHGHVRLPLPEDPLYYRLKSFLQQYRKLEKEVRWDLLPLPAVPVSPGEKAAWLGTVKNRLRLLGDFISSDTTGVYDVDLDSAVVRYRKRHLLSAKRCIDSSLVSSLNITPASRVRQLLVNMERCRWLPKRPHGDFLVVNIPEYRLHLFHNDLEVWGCPVIVGKATTRTTVFTGKLSEVVFCPYWKVPRRILEEELLPDIKSDPGYLKRNHLEIRTLGSHPVTVSPASINWKKTSPGHFPYEIRQLPGPWNSLGQIKFLLPNNFSIYLHDTPSRGLFSEQRRMFSHGCIRVSEPVRLARYVLDDPSWNEKQIRRKVAQGEELSVRLRKQVPVYLLYFTAWADENGILHFAEDGYGHDVRLAEELFGK